MSITSVNTGLNFYARCSANISGTPGAGSVTPSGGASLPKYRDWSGAANGFYPYVIEFGNAWEMGCTFWNGTVLTRPGPGKDPYFESSTGALINISAAGATIACESLPQTLVHPYPVRPPTPALFTYAHDASSFSSFVDYTDDRGYRLGRSDTGKSGEGYSFRGKAVPSGDWTATCFVYPNLLAISGGYYRYGLGAVNSSTGAAMLVTANTQGGSPRYSSFTMTNDSTYGTFIADWGWGNWWNPPVFGMRLVKSGATYTFQISYSCGSQWDTQGTNASFTPDKIGLINESFNGVGSYSANVVCCYYSDNDYPG